MVLLGYSPSFTPKSQPASRKNQDRKEHSPQRNCRESFSPPGLAQYPTGFRQRSAIGVWVGVIAQGRDFHITRAQEIRDSLPGRQTVFAEPGLILAPVNLIRTAGGQLWSWATLNVGCASAPPLSHPIKPPFSSLSPQARQQHPKTARWHGDPATNSRGWAPSQGTLWRTGHAGNISSIQPSHL